MNPFYEIVERSLTTGGVSKVYSGYESEEAARADVDGIQEEGFWYEVREER